MPLVNSMKLKLATLVKKVLIPNIEQLTTIPNIRTEGLILLFLR